MFEMAGKPMPSLRMSANCTEPSRLMEPGKVTPSSSTIMPMKAIMAMRPCLISTARRRARPSWSSQNGPVGSIGPGSTPMSAVVSTAARAGAPPPPPKLKATAGAARRARASLAILLSAEGVSF